MKEVLANVNGFDWLVLTSVNGVAEVKRVLENLNLQLDSRVKIAAIGPATAKATLEAFKMPEVVPDEYISEAIAPLLGDVSDKRILLARADLARADLANTLRASGAEVTELAVYRIVPAHSVDPLKVMPDYVTVTSAASTRATVENLSRSGLGSAVPESKWVCIGPITEAAARELGCNVVAVAAEYTIPGLVEALIKAAGEELAHA